jgi:adenylosuccinate lyase
MKQSSFNPLSAISPIDGRYRYLTEELSNYFSEFAVIKYRIGIEIKYLIALSENGIIRKLKADELKMLNKIITNFSLYEAEKVKKIEKITRHDKKAIEYYLKENTSDSSLKDVLEYIHFGLTSYDIENIVHRLMIKDGLNKALLPKLIELDNNIFKEAKNYKSLPMLARTHGQPAVPTTLGKELLVFHERLIIEIEILENLEFRGKLNGAVGNYSALNFSFPKVNWGKFSREFLKEYQLENSHATTQIPPYEDIIYLFQTIQRINGILLDFVQDMWRYISDGWFNQENIREKVGSSTMPQKINPINFEQAEGNIIIANSLIDGFTNKLPISRLQRDLSDSTISRNFGVVFAHSSIAYELANKGLGRIKANEEKINIDLNSDWSILSEAIQIYLKKEGIKNGYELVKILTRGKKMNQQDFFLMINKLPISDKQKSELKKLTPENYIGIV